MQQAVLAASLLLSGCGAAYTSPTVRAGAEETGGGYTVTIVAMTPLAISKANRSEYTPRKAPIFADVTAAHQTAETNIAAQHALPPDIDPGPYRIGISDVVSMTLASYGTGISDLVAGAPVDPRVQTYTVQDDKAIAIPNVGRIAVAGMTLVQAEERVFNALVSKQLDPGFSLDVAQFNARQVVVGGLVGSPGRLPITLKPLFLAEALQLAGGPSSSPGDVVRVRLQRGTESYVLSLPAVYSERGRQVRLVDGDMVIVERSHDAAVELEHRRIALQEAQIRDQIGAMPRDYVYLAGEVAKPSRIALPFGSQTSLADILFESGGIAIRSGDYARIYVLRLRGGTDVSAYHLNAANAVNLVAAQAFEMRPGDIVFVAEQPVTAWNRTLSQLFPSIVAQTAAQVN